MRKSILQTFLFLVLAAVTLSAVPAARAQSGGRLVIWRVPGLGDDLFVGVTVDGRHAADLPYGHHVDTVLPPGRHIIKVQPYPKIFAGAAAAVVVNVRPGELYNFTVKGSARQLFLSRS
jgi:hypothetical protein